MRPKLGQTKTCGLVNNEYILPMTPYEQTKEFLLAAKKKITSRSILFLNNENAPFAGINKAGVWMSVTKQEKKNWYSYLSTRDEETLQLKNLKYSETCNLAKELVEKLLSK